MSNNIAVPILPVRKVPCQYYVLQCLCFKNVTNIGVTLYFMSTQNYNNKQDQ
jgi:hypothetical protein